MSLPSNCCNVNVCLLDWEMGGGLEWFTIDDHGRQNEGGARLGSRLILYGIYRRIYLIFERINLDLSLKNYRSVLCKDRKRI